MLTLYAPTAMVVASSWTLLAGTGLLAGLLCLDETGAVQSWLGQPLPAALLTGLLWGRPEVGLAVGFPLQMVLVGNLPVGQSFVGDPVTAAVAVTAAACRASLAGIGMPDGSLSLDVALWGWLLLGAGLLSLVGHRLVRAEREAFGLWMHEGRLSLRDGDPGRLERLHLQCVGVTFLRGAALSIVYVLLVQELWLPVFPRLGMYGHRALALLPFLLPGLGIGALIERYGCRRCWTWLVAGAGLALLSWGVLAS